MGRSGRPGLTPPCGCWAALTEQAWADALGPHGLPASAENCAGTAAQGRLPGAPALSATRRHRRRRDKGPDGGPVPSRARRRQGTLAEPSAVGDAVDGVEGGLEPVQTGLTAPRDYPTRMSLQAGPGATLRRPRPVQGGTALLHAETAAGTCRRRLCCLRTLDPQAST